jgi:hypothetical protein
MLCCVSFRIRTCSLDIPCRRPGGENRGLTFRVGGRELYGFRRYLDGLVGRVELGDGAVYCTLCRRYSLLELARGPKEYEGQRHFRESLEEIKTRFILIFEGLDIDNAV